MLHHSWMFGILFSSIAVILFGFKQECCVLTDESAVGKRWMCSASPLHCCVLASVTSLLSSLPGSVACVPFSGSQASMDPPIHPSIHVHGTLPVHLPCLQTLVLENKLKASSPTQPQRTASQFSHYFSNLNCKHDFVAFNCQSLLDLFSPLGHECCKWVSLWERINSLSYPPFHVSFTKRHSNYPSSLLF